MKDLNILITLAIISIFVLIGGMFLLNSSDPQSEEPKAFCATIGPSHSSFTSEGKELFVQNCAACHNKNMKSAATGPALGGFMKRWNNDTTTVLHYLNNDSKYLDTVSNQRMQSLKNQSTGFVEHMSLAISNDDLKALTEYIENRY